MTAIGTGGEGARLATGNVWPALLDWGSCWVVTAGNTSGESDSGGDGGLTPGWSEGDEVWMTAGCEGGGGGEGVKLVSIPGSTDDVKRG